MIGKKRRAGIPQNRRRLAFEPLEDRTLLSVCVWNGGSSANSNWRTPENWVGNAAPQPGDDLQFAGGARTSTNNDFTAGMSFDSINFSANGFSVAGNNLNLTNDITVDSGVTGSAISLNIALGGVVTADVAADTDLTISGVLSGNNYLTKTGAGTLVLAGANTYAGGTVIDDGTLKLENNYALGVVPSSNGLLVNGGTQLDVNGCDINVGGVGLIDGSIHSSTAAALTATSFMLLNGTIDVPLDGNAAPLLKGTLGAVTLSGDNGYTGLTTLYAGQLTFIGPDAWNPILNGGGADIQDGKIVLDYNYTGGTTPAATVQTALTDSYNAAGGSFTSGQLLQFDRDEFDLGSVGPKYLVHAESAYRSPVRCTATPI